ncbi:hypothetical protein D3C86_1851520 [compost metagenome]
MAWEVERFENEAQLAIVPGVSELPIIEGEMAVARVASHYLTPHARLLGVMLPEEVKKGLLERVRLEP